LAYRELYFQKKWFSAASPVNPKKASATLTFDDAVVAAETVTIGDEVYEFVAAAGSITKDTNIAVVVGENLTADNAVAKLATAINANSSVVTAVSSTTNDTVVISYIAVGTAGNDINIAKTCTNASFGDGVTALSGGQYGTPCPVADVIVYASPHYYWCITPGNQGNVAWQKFTPETY
jgi:hypothetical protein